MIQIMRPPRAVLTEPFHIPETFVTGMELPNVHPDFARLIFWTDQPLVFGGDDPILERQVAAKLVMTGFTFRMVRKLLSRTSDGN